MNETLFVHTFLGTILLTRVFLCVFPLESPTIHGFRLHHYMYGLILMPTGIFFSDVLLFAVGLGLFVDEVGFLAIGGETHEDNFSPASFAILLGLVLTVLFSRSLWLSWL